MKRNILPILSGVFIGCALGIVFVSALGLNTRSEKIEVMPVQASIVVSSTADESSTDSTESNKETSKVDESSLVDGSKIGTETETGQKVLYLTFDDGPSALTPKVLDILDKYNIKATFFVTGFDTQRANYIKIAHDKGHTIGLHTYTHDYSKVYASPKAYYQDLNKIAALCKEQLGYVPHYIRFPGGSSNTVSSDYYKGIMSFLVKDVHQKGYQYYDWNCANGDATGEVATATDLYKNAISYVGQTDLVMLCHDAGDKQATVESLPKIIEYYQANGYIFKAIDDTSFVAHHQTNN